MIHKGWAPGHEVIFINVCGNPRKSLQASTLQWLGTGWGVLSYSQPGSGENQPLKTSLCREHVLSLLFSGFSYSRLNILVKEFWGPQELRDRGEDVFSEAARLLAPDSLTYQASQALF